jgi:hypothetical protein
MAVVTMWVACAGEGAFLFKGFERLSVAGIGGGEIEPLCNFRPGDDSLKPAGLVNTQVSSPSNAISAGRDYRFIRTMRVSDAVLTHNGAAGARLVSTVAGDRAQVRGATDEQPAARNANWHWRALKDQLWLMGSDRSWPVASMSGSWTRLISSGGRRNHMGRRTRKPKAFAAARISEAHVVGAGA